MKYEERHMIRFCHLLELAMLVGTIAVLIVFKGRVSWPCLLLPWGGIFLGAGLQRYFFFQKITRNLSEILQTAEGTLHKGSYFFFTPPHIRFSYKNKECCVRSVIDKDFRLLIEYSCQFEKEAEFRIIRTKGKKEPAGGEAAAPVYRVEGENREFYDRLQADPRLRDTLDDIMQKFTYLFYGKDAVMHLEEMFDSYLTRKQTILPVLDKMIFVGRSLRLDEEK